VLLKGVYKQDAKEVDSFCDEDGEAILEKRQKESL